MFKKKFFILESGVKYEKIIIYNDAFVKCFGIKKKKKRYLFSWKKIWQ